MCLNFSLHENIQAVTKPRVLKNQQIYCHLDLRVYNNSLSFKNNASEDVFLSVLLIFSDIRIVIERKLRSHLAANSKVFISEN